jgi:hypothetical protein
LPYFYHGKLITNDDPLAGKVKAAAEYLLDYFDSQATQLKKYPNLWRSEKDAWEANIIDQFAWSPVLCWYLEVNKSWWSDELFALMQKGRRETTKRAHATPLMRCGPKSWRSSV